MTTTKFDVVSMALVIIGEKPLSSFDETDPGIAAGILYDKFVEQMIASYPWSFSKKRAVLSIDLTPPDNVWANKSELPPDAINVITLRVENLPIDYQIEGKYVLHDANSSNLPTLEYQFIPEINNWTPDFREAFIYKLASIFAGAITDKPDLVSLNERIFRDRLELAKYADSARETTRRFKLPKFRGRLVS